MLNIQNISMINMKKYLLIFIISLFAFASHGQVTTTKWIKVANSTTIFNENLLNGIGIINLDDDKAYLTLKTIASNKSISTCVIDVDLKEIGASATPVDSIRFSGTNIKTLSLYQGGDTIPIISQFNDLNGEVVNCFAGTGTITSTQTIVTFPKSMNYADYPLNLRAWYNKTISGKSVQIENAIYDFSKTVNGFSFKVDTVAGNYSYMAVDTLNLYPITFDNYVPVYDTVRNAGYATNYKLKKYRLLSDHDSLIQLQERSYNSLTEKPDLSVYKLKTDSTVLSGYFTNYKALSKEDKSNKVISLSGSSTDAQYPSAKLTYDQLALKEPVITAPSVPDPWNYFWNGQKTFTPIVVGNGGYAANVYFTTSTSTTSSSYKQLNYTPEPNTTTLTATVSNQELLVRTYISDITINSTIIDAGQWNVYYKYYVSNATGNTQIKFETFLRHSDTSETTLFSFYSDDLNSTSIIGTQVLKQIPSFSCVATDKLGVRLYFKTTSLASITVHTLIGDGNASYFNTPFKIRHEQLRDLLWVDSGHYGTANTLASFDSGGLATNTVNNSTNWNTAYDKSITGLSYSGSTLSITTQGGATYTTTITTSSGTGEIWTSLTGTYASATTFTFSGTDKNAKLVEMSLFTCTNSAGTTRRIGYVKTATNSSGTITCSVVTDTDLASGDKDFKVAYNRKATDYMRLITIPGECIVDASYSQGMWYSDISVASYLLPVDASVLTAAAGTGAALTFNVYSGASTLFSTAPDMSTNTVLRSQRPTTNTISATSNVSLRILSSDGATNKAADFQAKLYIVPQNIYTAFGMNHFMMLILLLISLGGNAQIKGYWRMNGNSNDASGNGYNMTNENSPTFNQGINNSCINFGTSNTNKRSYVNTNFGMTYSSNRSISFWIKILANPVVFTNAMQNIYATNPGNYTSLYIDKPSAIRLSTNTGSYYNNVVLNVWYHVVITHNHSGNQVKLYVNGKLIYTDQSFTSNYSSFTTSLSIGGASPNFVSCMIDNLKLFSHILTPSEVKNEYTFIKGFFTKRDKCRIIPDSSLFQQIDILTQKLYA